MAKKTEHFGASEERDAIRRKVRRLIREAPNLLRLHPDAETVLHNLEVWIDKRTERFKRRKGGL